MKLLKIQNATPLKTKVNSLEKKIVDATTVFHINQCNTDKHSLEKRIWDVDKIVSDTSDYNCLNTKISEVDNKIPNTSNLVTTAVLNTKISEVENKILDNFKYITILEFNNLTTEMFVARLKQVDSVKKMISIIN